MVTFPGPLELTVILTIIFLLFGAKIFKRFLTNIKETVLEVRKTVSELQEGLEDE